MTGSRLLGCMMIYDNGVRRFLYALWLGGTVSFKRLGWWSLLGILFISLHELVLSMDSITKMYDRR